jgi:hypothetical protein
VNHRFFIVWATTEGRDWSGPHDSIDDARASVPESAAASLILMPLPAMTHGEKLEALPILEGKNS